MLKWRMAFRIGLTVLLTYLIGFWCGMVDFHVWSLTTSVLTFAIIGALTYLFIYVLDDYIALKSFNGNVKSDIERNFDQIEVNELTRKLETSNDNAEELQNQINDSKAREELFIRDLNNSRFLLAEMSNAYIETILIFIESAEDEANNEKGHCRRVMELSCEIGKRLEISERELEILKFSAVLHDIGKLKIVNTVTKSEHLDEHDVEVLKKHPLIGYDLIWDIPFLKNAADVIIQHHERFDGTGYPYGLEGEKINILSRIIAVADSFEAMISERLYKKEKSINDALDEIEKGCGKQFDPVIAQILVNMIKESENFQDRFREEEKNEGVGKAQTEGS